MDVPKKARQRHWAVHTNRDGLLHRPYPFLPALTFCTNTYVDNSGPASSS
jgi:hypothetical protein